ncbi:VOC family protein [Nocardia uniformis]|uniref:VOC family protein n=1 Tax=Nocardia uniformis TaxID=53432 RepID=A0A849C0V6_9NOCA|nr:VOC family protein [Nocardia uniformis]NNH71096.1 VOC family protein [Nocardia uniformis]
MIRWIWVFLDRPAARFDESAQFWTAITETRVSETRGENSEFVTLLPESGAPSVKMQAVPDDTRIHLDLDVDDVGTETKRAQELGATLVLEHPDYTVLKSPHGMTFCLTPAGGSGGEPTPVVRSPDGARSRLDQVCIDIGASDYEAESRFWAEFTGWSTSASARSEYSRLRPDEPLAIKILLQRLDEDRPTSAHLDLACSDVDATAAWHESLGARLIDRRPDWTVLEDPSGQPYCITARQPD